MGGRTVGTVGTQAALNGGEVGMGRLEVVDAMFEQLESVTGWRGVGVSAGSTLDIAESHGEILESGDGDLELIEFGRSRPSVGPGGHHESRIGGHHFAHELCPRGVVQSGGLLGRP